MGMCRSAEWVKECIDEFFADTTRTPQETYVDLNDIVDYIRILQNSLETDMD